MPEAGAPVTGFVTGLGALTVDGAEGCTGDTLALPPPVQLPTLCCGALADVPEPITLPALINDATLPMLTPT